METVDYIDILKRWSWLIVLCPILSGVSAFAISTRTPAVFEAGAAMLLRQSAPDGEMSYDTLLASQQLAKTYSWLAIQTPVLEEVTETLGLNETVESFSDRVRAEAILNTSLLEITVQDTDPQRAADAANMMATVFMRQFRDRELQRYTDARRSLAEEQAPLEISISHLEAQLADDATDSLSDDRRFELEQTLRLQRLNQAQLTASMTQMQLAKAQLHSEFVLVNPATRAGKVGPRPQLNAAVGAAAGLAIAVILAVFVEARRHFRAERVRLQAPLAQ